MQRGGFREHVCPFEEDHELKHQMGIHRLFEYLLGLLGRIELDQASLINPLFTLHLHCKT
jgi:hypothetical protein